jgi:hypothetical protein
VEPLVRPQGEARRRTPLVIAYFLRFPLTRFLRAVTPERQLESVGLPCESRSRPTPAFWTPDQLSEVATGPSDLASQFRLPVAHWASAAASDGRRSGWSCTLGLVRVPSMRLRATVAPRTRPVSCGRRGALAARGRGRGRERVPERRWQRQRRWAGSGLRACRPEH